MPYVQFNIVSAWKTCQDSMLSTACSPGDIIRQQDLVTMSDKEVGKRKLMWLIAHTVMSAKELYGHDLQADRQAQR